MLCSKNYFVGFRNLKVYSGTLKPACLMTVAIGRMKSKSFSVKYVTACPLRPARPVRPIHKDLMILGYRKLYY